MIPIADAVTPDTYVGIQTLRQYLFDEVHYINDKDRGTVWEESIILLPKNIILVIITI